MLIVAVQFLIGQNKTFDRSIYLMLLLYLTYNKPAGIDLCEMNIH